MKIFFKSLLGVMLLSVSNVVYAQATIDGSKPADILGIARGYGTANLDKDQNGDPKIIGKVNGTDYYIYFYQCNNHSNCKVIQFRSYWADKKVSLDAINKYNSSKVMGKAYLDSDGYPTFELPINLDGGVSYKNMDDNFDWWKTILDGFKTAVIK